MPVRRRCGRATGSASRKPPSVRSYHRLLSTLGGWAQYARYRLFQAELGGGTDAALTDLLAIRLVWEEALFARYEALIAEGWARVRAAHAAPVAPTPDLVVDAILQEAAERAAQRSLADAFPGAASAPAVNPRPTLQAAFCIDVRSEMMRRALESLDPGIETARLRRLLRPRHGAPAVRVGSRGTAAAGSPRTGPVLLRRHGGGRGGRPDGPYQGTGEAGLGALQARGGLLVRLRGGDRADLCRQASRRCLHRKHAPPPAGPAPRFAPDPGLDARIAAAETVLRAMSLTERFAPVVLLLGHGADVVNNPHASALQCGACGGYSGEVNARLLAGLLNDDAVRSGLVEKGIAIPADTRFVAGLHDTTTDRVTLYRADAPAGAALGRGAGAAQVAPTGHSGGDLARAEAWLAAAGEIARAERAARLPGATDADAVAARSWDWAQTRPEWGLAGCRAFVAAPRSRTADRNLEGRVFLHDYVWARDADFRVLELILTAPVVVASWISLQYYGSAVAPAAFGGGNKLLHNVTGGVGSSRATADLTRRPAVAIGARRRALRPRALAPLRPRRGPRARRSSPSSPAMRACALCSTTAGSTSSPSTIPAAWPGATSRACRGRRWGRGAGWGDRSGDQPDRLILSRARRR